jgi:hypothetical protein
MVGVDVFRQSNAGDIGGDLVVRTGAVHHQICLKLPTGGYTFDTGKGHLIDRLDAPRVSAVNFPFRVGGKRIAHTSGQLETKILRAERKRKIALRQNVRRGTLEVQLAILDCYHEITAMLRLS